VNSTWSLVWTPQFLVGTIVAGLFLNVVSAYVVRAADRLVHRVTGAWRAAVGEEAARTQQLSAAAAADNALYAALAAEASRLRSHQLLHFFIAFVLIATFICMLALDQGEPRSLGVLGLLVLLGLFVVGFVQYNLGLESGKRARRLDNALRAVHASRKLPIMD
jgi:hypothetical protein